MSHFWVSVLWNQTGILGSRADTRDFPGSPALRTLASNAGDAGSIPGWEAEILHAFPPKQKNKKTKKTQKQYHNKFKKDLKNDPHQKKRADTKGGPDNKIAIPKTIYSHFRESFWESTGHRAVFTY